MPSVSPDGQQIAYWSRHGARFGIAVMASNGANERLLSDTPADVTGLQPVWRSPTEILFTAPPAGSSSTFLVIPAPGTPRTLMSVNTGTGVAAAVGALPDLAPTLGVPQYLPTSGELFYLTDDYRTLRSHSLVDGRTSTVATFADEMEVNSFRASPDGRRIAYALGQRYSNGRACFDRTLTPLESVDEMTTSCGMGILDVATGSRTPLVSTRNPQTIVAWSPDGRFLLYGGGRPQVWDLATGETWPLIDQRTPITWENRTASWSPDGTFIVLDSLDVFDEWHQWTGVR